MRTKEELDRLRERAITLRREGKSRTEIQAILGLVGRSTLNELLRGVPPPDWTRRPNAKDDLRDKARQLRAEGLNYNQITARLGVSRRTNGSLPPPKSANSRPGRSSSPVPSPTGARAQSPSRTASSIASSS
jgi:transposase